MLPFSCSGRPSPFNLCAELHDTGRPSVLVYMCDEHVCCVCHRIPFHRPSSPPSGTHAPTHTRNPLFVASGRVKRIPDMCSTQQIYLNEVNRLCKQLPASSIKFCPGNARATRPNSTASHYIHNCKRWMWLLKH